MLYSRDIAGLNVSNSAARLAVDMLRQMRNREAEKHKQSNTKSLFENDLIDLVRSLTG